MGERIAWGSRQFVVAVAVLAFHVTIVVAFIYTARLRNWSSPAAPVITTLLFASTKVFPTPFAVARIKAPKGNSTSVAPSMISPYTPATSTLDRKPAPFDWSESARQAAVRIAAPQTKKEFGNVPNQDETDGRAPLLSS